MRIRFAHNPKISAKLQQFLEIYKPFLFFSIKKRTFAAKLMDYA
jgi:hypothetical protein